MSLAQNQHLTRLTRPADAQQHTDVKVVSWNQVFLPLLPGVESIYEPAMESAEEVVDDIKENMDQALGGFRKP